MQLDAFFPAPPALPVPINPRRENNDICKLLMETDWVELLEVKTDLLVKAGALWLFGFLEESHRLVQQDCSREGKYWHALIHRSEGDFSNSLYWFNQVGEHPIFEVIRSKWALERARSEINHEWSPEFFVTLCKKVRQGNSESKISVDVQLMAQMEYNFLMQFVLQQSKS